MYDGEGKICGRCGVKSAPIVTVCPNCSNVLPDFKPIQTSARTSGSVTYESNSVEWGQLLLFAVLVVVIAAVVCLVGSIFQGH